MDGYIAGSSPFGAKKGIVMYSLLYHYLIDAGPGLEQSRDSAETVTTLDCDSSGVGTRSATNIDAVLRDQDWLGVVDCRQRTMLMMSTFGDVK